MEAARTAELNPNSIFAKSGLGYVSLYQGKYSEAEQAVANAPNEWHTLWIRSIACFAQGKMRAADEAVGLLIASNGDTAAAQIATTFAFRGENDKTFEWLARALKQPRSRVGHAERLSFFENVRGDPRWAPFWDSMGFSAKAYL